MKKIFLTIFVFAIATLTFANHTGDNSETPKNPEAPVQTVKLTGKVLDVTSGEALAGVEVSIEGSDFKTYTDFDGNYTIENVKQGTYNIIASFISYKKSLVENYTTSDKENEVDIKLEESK
jgi:predicted nicotinamide N-methyase